MVGVINRKSLLIGEAKGASCGSWEESSCHRSLLGDLMLLPSPGEWVFHQSITQSLFN